MLDCVLTERTEDGFGNTQRKTEYTYDIAGNCIQVVAYIDGKPSITRTEYNSRNLPVRVIDPEGNFTVTTYRYDYHDSFGQCVPYKEITDPIDHTTVLIEDGYGNVVEIHRRDAQGALFQKQEYYFDANGNPESLVQTVLSSHAPDRQVITHWEYDSMNRLTKCVEAVHAPEQKETETMYNAYGQKERIIKADGTVIIHSYDSLGRLSTLKALDDSIIYQYEYDLNSNLTKTIDCKRNTATLKTYDIHNRLLSETLDNGLQVSYEYDRLGRPIYVTLPDQTSITYVYQGVNLLESKSWKILS